MNDFLVHHLARVDNRLLEYVDDEHELQPETVWRLGICAGALLDCSITPSLLAEDWPDWFILVTAFVAAYGPPELTDMESKATFMIAPEVDAEVDDANLLTKDDAMYLEALRFYLDAYPEFRHATTD